MLPIICIRRRGTRDIRYFQFQTRLFFTFICPLLITPATKLYLPSETRTYHAIFMQDTTKKRIFRGEFSFVRRKRHARVISVFFFRLSHGVGRVFIYKV